MIIGLLFFIATMGANGFYFGQKMFYLLLGADLNAQFKIVYANGKSVGSGPDKLRIKGTAALAKLLVDSMKGSQNKDAASRKKSMNSVNDASVDNGSSEKHDSEKELEATLRIIKPDEKAYFLTHDVRYNYPMFNTLMIGPHNILTLFFSSPLMYMIDVQVPSGVDEMFCKDRIALWTFLYQELEKKNAREGLYSGDGRFSIHSINKPLLFYHGPCTLLHPHIMISHFSSLSPSYIPQRVRFMTRSGWNVSSTDINQIHLRLIIIVQMTGVHHL